MRQIIFGLVVLAYAGTVRADLSFGLSPTSVALSAKVSSANSVDHQDAVLPSLGRSLGGAAAADGEWSAGMLDGGAGLLDNLYEGSVALPNAPVLREIRPLPSSAALFFTAMLSLGALQVFRHPPSLHLSALPSWYHTGGAVQVGHVTPLDLDFHSLTLCVFEPANGGLEDRLVIYGAAADQVNRLLPQVVLSPAAPRGPPSAA